MKILRWYLTFLKKEEILSSIHDTANIHDTTRKPDIIISNETKGGFYVADTLYLNYNCARNIHCWSMVIFYNLLKIANINSQIIYNYNRPQNMLQRHFLHDIT